MIGCNNEVGCCNAFGFIAVRHKFNCAIVMLPNSCVDNNAFYDIIILLVNADLINQQHGRDSMHSTENLYKMIDG